MTNTAAAVLEDEVSATIRHFRPRPGFIPKSDAHEWRSGTGRIQQRDQRAYSSVVYDRNDDVLRLTYLHSPQVACAAASKKGGRPRICFFLTFEMDIQSRFVTCVSCNGPSDDVSAKFQRDVIDPMCSRLSSSADSPSLFSVTSQLLQGLNQLPETYDQIKRAQLESVDSLVSRIATVQPAKPSSAVRRMLDIQTLLVRCAAAGRNRAKICSPIPVEFASSINQDGDLLARQVFSATNQMYSADFRRQGNQMKRAHDEDQHAWTMLTFLLSLPWSKGGRLTSNNSNEEAKIAKITLDVSSALGDEAPEFTRYASRCGTVQVFHGTKIENAWSILNHGLRNLSYDNTLSENGAMMGAGVYLSTAFEVADMFAQTAMRNTTSLAYAFQHESLLRLLHHANVDLTSLGPLDEYDISCLPVFEATIIAPPPAQDEDAEEVAKTSTAIDTKKVTRQEGKYFVADSDLIRITKLHLRFDLAKRSSVWSWLSFRPPLYVIVLIVAIVWILILEEE